MRASLYFVSFLFFIARLHAASVTLEWDPNSESDLAGYRVYYGTASGAYASVLDVGLNTRATVPNLADGQTYYFAVTAYNLSGMESSPSSEVTYAMPLPVNQAPAIAIATPSDGSNYDVPASITFTSNAGDADGFVAKVEYFTGGNKLGESAVSPYALTWNEVPGGSHTVIAIVTDNLGSTASSAVTFNVVALPPNQAPAVALASSGSSFLAPANFTLIANATDLDGTVVRVEYYHGPVKLGETTQAPHTWSVTNAPAGVHSFHAVAVDDRGAASQSNVISVAVEAENALPIVALTSPQDGSFFNTPAVVTVAASATDSDGAIDRVEFFAGTTLVGRSTSFPYTVAWSDAPAGIHTLRAVAYDNFGASATSADVKVTVNASPTVEVSATVTSFAAGEGMTITASASDPDGSIRQVDFYSGSILLGKDKSDPYSFTWRNVPAGNHVITAVATDNRNAKTRSAPFVVNVTQSDALRSASIALPQVRPLGTGYEGEFEIHIVGDAGEIYDVWLSDDMREWSLLVSVLNAEGAVTVGDPDRGPTGSRFYRVSKH